MNRKFSIDLENTIPVQVDNGKEVITVKAFVLGEYKDEAPCPSACRQSSLLRNP